MAFASVFLWQRVKLGMGFTGEDDGEPGLKKYLGGSYLCAEGNRCCASVSRVGTVIECALLALIWERLRSEQGRDCQGLGLRQDRGAQKAQSIRSFSELSALT